MVLMCSTYLSRPALRVPIAAFPTYCRVSHCCLPFHVAAGFPSRSVPGFRLRRAVVAPPDPVTCSAAAVALFRAPPWPSV